MLQGVLADVSIATGYVTIALMLGGRFVFQYFGWQVSSQACRDTGRQQLLPVTSVFLLSVSAQHTPACCPAACTWLWL